MDDLARGRLDIPLTRQGQPERVRSGADTRVPHAGFIRELEGLRAVAIGWVMLHRFWPQTGPLAAYSGFANLGWIGVDLFFVISGFLIAGILIDNKGQPGYYRNFYARRALRIFPLYYLFVVLTLLVFPLVEGGPYFQTDFIRHAGSPLYYLFYLGNLPEMLGRDPPFFLAPVWSLAIEEQFYILFPFVVAALSRKRVVHVLLAAVAFAPLFRLITLFAFPDNERIQYLATPSRFDEIALGCLLAVAVRSRRFWLRPRDTTLVLAGVSLVFAATLGAGALDRTDVIGRIAGYSVVAVTCAAVVLWAVTHREHASAAWLRAASMMYVGKLCYGLYLLHRPASFLVEQALARAHIDPSASSVLLLPLKIAVALGLASLSWYLFELPILGLKRRFASEGPVNPRLGDPRKRSGGLPGYQPTSTPMLGA